MISLLEKVLAQGQEPGGGQEPLITPPAGLPTDVCALLNNLTDFALKLAIVVTPFFVLWAAWLFISAGGNENQITTARRILFYVIVGFVVVLLSRGLVLVIQDVLGVSVTGLCGVGGVGLPPQPNFPNRGLF